MTTNKEILEAARNIDTASSPGAQPNILVENSSNTQSNLDTLRTFVTENPGPSILIGAGLAWLFVNRERNRVRPLPTRIADGASNLKQGATESLHDAREATAARYESVKEKTSQQLGHASEVAHHNAEKLKSRYESMLEESPLALGACALAAGLALGLLLPQTRRENELLGEARDSLMDQALSIVNEARQAAVSTLSSGKESVQEKLVEAKDEAQNVIRESIAEAKDAAKSEIDSAKPNDILKTRTENMDE